MSAPPPSAVIVYPVQNVSAVPFIIIIIIIPDCTSEQRPSHHWSYVWAGLPSPRSHPAPPPSSSSTASHLSPGSSDRCAAQPATLGTTASVKHRTRDNRTPVRQDEGGSLRAKSEGENRHGRGSWNWKKQRHQSMKIYHFYSRSFYSSRARDILLNTIQIPFWPWWQTSRSQSAQVWG